MQIQFDSLRFTSNTRKAGEAGSDDHSNTDAYQVHWFSPHEAKDYLGR